MIGHLAQIFQYLCMKEFLNFCEPEIRAVTIRREDFVATRFSSADQQERA